MQDTLRLMIMTIVGLVVVWFLAMALDIYFFEHTDADPVVYGLIPMNKTGIGSQCGSDSQNNSEFVHYKLNSENQIVYLCPLGIWPVRGTVVMTTITEAFRLSIPPIQRARINPIFPPQAPQTQQNVNPMLRPTNQAVPVQQNVSQQQTIQPQTQPQNIQPQPQSMQAVPAPPTTLPVPEAAPDQTTTAPANP